MRQNSRSRRSVGAVLTKNTRPAFAPPIRSAARRRRRREAHQGCAQQAKQLSHHPAGRLPGQNVRSVLTTTTRRTIPVRPHQTQMPQTADHPDADADRNPDTACYLLPRCSQSPFGDSTTSCAPIAPLSFIAPRASTSVGAGYSSIAAARGGRLRVGMCRGVAPPPGGHRSAQESLLAAALRARRRRATSTITTIPAQRISPNAPPASNNRTNNAA